jgi:hypothetical protein
VICSEGRPYTVVGEYVTGRGPDRDVLRVVGRGDVKQARHVKRAPFGQPGREGREGICGTAEPPERLPWRKAPFVVRLQGKSLHKRRGESRVSPDIARVAIAITYW